jgi:hypothetical protein
MWISLHKFYFDAITRGRVNRERYGQAMFNHLHEVRPDLSEQVRGTDKDPFYVESLKDPRWNSFVEFIESNWTKCLREE